MFGKLVGAAGNLLAAIYLESMSRWLCTVQYSTVQYSAGNEQVAVAAGQHAATKPHWRIPHLHHDD